jgi:hypothetical protein
MKLNDKSFNYISFVGICICFAIIAYVLFTFPVEKLDFNLIVFSVVTIFFSSISSMLQIPLPFTKLYFSTSDALLFVSILVYGYEVTTIIAFLDCLFGSLAFINKPAAKINFSATSLNLKFYINESPPMMRLSTIALNIAIGTITVFITGYLVNLLDPNIMEYAVSGKLATLVAMLFLMTFIEVVSKVVETEKDKNSVSLF